jgi:hypothetical protein
MQSVEEIEKPYSVPDPWGFKKNPDDLKRKNKILDICTNYILYENAFGSFKYKNALDIGCGEAWITESLPSQNKYGYELSSQARSRWRSWVENYNPVLKYDLILATGILYYHYDYPLFIKMINDHSSRIIVTCNIKDWEVKEINQIKAAQIHEEEFSYREYTQKLRVFKK